MLCASDENRFAFSPSARTEPAGSSGDIPLARNNNNILFEVLTILCNIYPEFSKDKEEWSLIKDARAAKTEYEMKVSKEKRRLIEECGQINYPKNSIEIADSIIGNHLEDTSSPYYQKFVIYTNPITRRAKFCSILITKRAKLCSISNKFTILNDFAIFNSRTATLDAHYKDNLDPALIQAIKDDPDLTQDSLVRFAKIHDFELYNKMLKAKEKLDSYMQEKEQEKEEKERSLKAEKISAKIKEILDIIQELPIGIENDPNRFTRFNLMEPIRNKIKKFFINYFLNIDLNHSHWTSFHDDTKKCLQEIFDYINPNIEAIRRSNANSYINDSDSLSTTQEEEYINKYRKNLLLRDKNLVPLLDNLIFAIINCHPDNIAEFTIVRNILIKDLIIKNKEFCDSFPDDLKKLIEDF
jgi:hypothetical protein